MLVNLGNCKMISEW